MTKTIREKCEEFFEDILETTFDNSSTRDHRDVKKIESFATQLVREAREEALDDAIEAIQFTESKYRDSDPTNWDFMSSVRALKSGQGEGGR